MYIRKTTKSWKGKTYTNYLLVESQHTPKGPRQRILCSLGSLSPAPAGQWLDLAHRLEKSLQGEREFPPTDAQLEGLTEQALRGRPTHTRAPKSAREPEEPGARVVVDADRIEMEKPREAGTVHVGHQMWQQLGLAEILERAGLSERACLLSEAMVLNRLIFPLSEHAMPEWMERTALDDVQGAAYSLLSDAAL